MKRFFAIIAVLIVALSIYGIYDTNQTKKEAAERAKMTSIFYANIDNIEKVDGKNKVTLTATEDSDKKFAGKKYSFVENKDFKAVNKEGKEAKLEDFKVEDKIMIQHVGKIKDGDVNELTGEVVIAPYVAQATQPTEATAAPTDATDATDAPSTEPTEETKAE